MMNKLIPYLIILIISLFFSYLSLVVLFNSPSCPENANCTPKRFMPGFVILTGVYYFILFIIYIFYKYIKKKAKARLKIDNIVSIFLLIIFSEIIFAVLFYIIPFYWANPCTTPNFFHPLGKDLTPGMLCIQVLVETIDPIFYIDVYLLILTMVIFGVYLIFKRKYR